MADENEAKALADRFIRRVKMTHPPRHIRELLDGAAREALRWRDETRPQQPAAAVPASLTAELAARLDKVLGCHADSMPKEAYFEVDAVMRALQAQPPAAAVPAGYVPLAAFIEAREQVENWGAYAAPYFQDKWDLAGTLAKMDEQIAAARKGE